MNPLYVLATLAAMAAVTFSLRALPFIAARWLTKSPFLQRLKDFLPLSIMTLLVLHAGAGAAAENPLGLWSVAAAIGFTVLLQWRLRHPLLSILGGTGLFIALCNISI